MRQKCINCGKRVKVTKNGICFECALKYYERDERIRHRNDEKAEQEKINVGLFTLIQLQQDTIDLLVKDNEEIRNRIADRRRFYGICRGATARDLFRRWRDEL